MQVHVRGQQASQGNKASKFPCELYVGANKFTDAEKASTFTDELIALLLEAQCVRRYNLQVHVRGRRASQGNKASKFPCEIHVGASKFTDADKAMQFADELQTQCVRRHCKYMCEGDRQAKATKQVNVRATFTLAQINLRTQKKQVNLRTS